MTSSIHALAELLDAAEWPDVVEARSLPASVCSLLHGAPAARDQIQRLESREGTCPSLFDLGRLLCAVESPVAFPECWPTALWLVRGSAAGRALYAPIAEAAEAAAGEEAAPMEQIGSLLLLQVHLDRLLADDEWEHPTDLLDPMRHSGCVEISHLLRLCERRLSRERDPALASRLQTVRDRLRHYRVVHQGAKALATCRASLTRRLRGEPAADSLDYEAITRVAAALEQLIESQGGGD